MKKINIILGFVKDVCRTIFYFGIWLASFGYYMENWAIYDSWFPIFFLMCSIVFLLTKVYLCGVKQK